MIGPGVRRMARIEFLVRPLHAQDPDLHHQQLIAQAFRPSQAQRSHAAVAETARVTQAESPEMLDAVHIRHSRPCCPSWSWRHMTDMTH